MAHDATEGAAPGLVSAAAETPGAAAKQEKNKRSRTGSKVLAALGEPFSGCGGGPADSDWSSSEGDAEKEEAERKRRRNSSGCPTF